MHGLLSSAQASFLDQPPGWAGGTSGGSAPAVPVNITPCSVAFASGATGLVGEQVEVTPGTWSDGSASLNYQWQRGGVNISGATGTTYTLTEADASQTLTCIETAANGDGSEFQASSNDVTPLALSDPTNTTAPVIAVDGSSILSSPGVWTGANPPLDTLRTYQWQEQVGASFFDLVGETATTLSSYNWSTGYRLIETVTRGASQWTATSNEVTTNAPP